MLSKYCSSSLGDSSIQCSRRPDALKVWLMWQARGLDGLASLVDHAFDMAKLVFDRLKDILLQVWNPKSKMYQKMNHYSLKTEIWFLQREWIKNHEFKDKTYFLIINLTLLNSNIFRILHRKLSESTSFKMVLPNPQGSTVCFWILPPKLQNVNFNDANYLQKLDKVSINYNIHCVSAWWIRFEVALAVKSEMVKRGNIMVNYQTLPDQNLVNFFRVTITCHPNLDENDINDLVNELKTLSELVDVD